MLSIYSFVFVLSVVGNIRLIDGAANQCWSCNSQDSDELCRQNGQLQTCSSGDTGGCQTVIRSHGGGRVSITKNCKSQSVCTSEVAQYASQCTGHDVQGSICYYCCTTNNCNNVQEGQCITSCSNVPDGDYQSCQGCNVYASCGGGIFYDNRPCSASSLRWDDSVKRCEYESTTCSGEGDSDSDDTGNTEIGVGECITSCSNVPDGDYQSCQGCNVYASCGGGIFYDNRPCSASSLRWDDSVKRCEYESTTCSDAQTTESTDTDPRSPASKCWSCTSAATDQECQDSGSEQTCSSGDFGGCQTEVRSYQNSMSITKRCKAESVCLSEETQYESQCTGYNVPQSICYHCCTSDNCNYNLPNTGDTVIATTEPTDDGDNDGDSSPASVCWACTNANDEAMCVSSGWEQTCSQGDTGGCQTEVRVYEHYKTITKRCKAESVCISEESQYAAQCTGYDDVGAICYDCCTTDLCNKNLPDDCVDSPCSNSGTCVDGLDEFTCDCSRIDYSGDTCDQKIDDCADSPCENGLCVDGVRSFTCDCSATDYEGDLCENKIDNCADSPCSNGECVDGLRMFTCDCSLTDYQGDTCENKIDDCADSPCTNGACVDGLRSYTCDCSDTDYDGNLCENKIDDCAGAPCTNGLCVDGVRSFTCDCSATDYEGDLCENKIDNCADSPCSNGECVDGLRMFTCDCSLTDYQGDTCENKIDDCAVSPCTNGACVDGVRSYTCDCTDTDYDGNLCENKIDDCAGAPCKNGVCEDGVRMFTCSCTGTDYEGTLCENKIDDCTPSACTNGVCVDGDQTFSCDCSQTDYEGDLCENKIDDCADSPCSNGVCQDGMRTFTCDCSDTDYEGTLCENRIDNCDDSLCNEGVCVDGLRSYTCDCSNTDCIGVNCQECPPECINTYVYLATNGPKCNTDPGKYCYASEVSCTVDSRGECVYNSLTMDGSYLQYCDGFNVPVCEIRLTVNGIEGNYSTRCAEASECINHNSLTCPDGNLDCSSCLLPYDPCETDVNAMPECYDAALHDYMQLHIVDTDAPEIQEPNAGGNFYGSWYLDGSCDCQANVKKYVRDCIRPTGQGRCSGRPYLLQPCDFLDCVCDADDFQCWSCEDVSSMEECEVEGCWQTCDNQADRMCLTTVKNYTHPSDPHVSISRSCVTLDTCIDLRFEYIDYNNQMEEILSSAEDTSELSKDVFLIKSGTCEAGDVGVPGGYNCGNEENKCIWMTDNSAKSWRSTLCLLVFALYKMAA